MPSSSNKICDVYSWIDYTMAKSKNRKHNRHTTSSDFFCRRYNKYRQVYQYFVIINCGYHFWIQILKNFWMIVLNNNKGKCPSHFSLNIHENQLTYLFIYELDESLIDMKSVVNTLH